jgi:hypothetical protein
MDALSSMATVAGYKAVLLAAAAAPRFPCWSRPGPWPRPGADRGAGVAGPGDRDRAPAGAVVEGYDIRPAAAEEVESLGAAFVGPKLSAAETQDASGYAKELTPEARAKAQELLLARIPQADVIITTARVPGLPAPKLIPADAVAKMKPGSVIIDLAADMGGNCALTDPGKEIVQHNVTIIGPIRLSATIPVHASQMYSRNVATFVLLMLKEGKLTLDFGRHHPGHLRHPRRPGDARGHRDRLKKAAGAGAGSGATGSGGAPRDRQSPERLHDLRARYLHRLRGHLKVPSHPALRSCRARTPSTASCSWARFWYWGAPTGRWRRSWALSPSCSGRSTSWADSW